MNCLTHPDVVRFLRLTDAVKLRLTCRFLLHECETARWCDFATPVRDLIKWKKCFPKSVALHFRPTRYEHELTVLSKYESCEETQNICADMNIRILVFPRCVRFEDDSSLWPLHTLNNLVSLTIKLDKFVLAAFQEKEIQTRNTLQSLVCCKGSNIKDSDFKLFWSLFPNLTDFDCAATCLSEAILRQPHSSLKFLTVNSFFFTFSSQEAISARKAGLRILSRSSLGFGYCGEREM